MRFAKRIWTSGLGGALAAVMACTVGSWAVAQETPPATSPAEVAPDQATKVPSVQPAAEATDAVPAAESPPSTAVGVSFSNAVTANWEVGFQAVAVNQSALNLFVTIPVPREWPEQTVSVVKETIPPEVGKVGDRELIGGVRQITVAVPRLKPQTEVRFLMTYQVKTSQINPPADPSVFLRPKSSHRDGKPHTGVGPQINFRDSKLRKQVKGLVADKDTPWQEVEAIYDWVRDNIDLRSSEARGIGNVFKEKHGCAEDLVGLFVGMCRANKIPARIVWVTGRQYAEFMLIDESKQAHWFPCVLVGPREFGSLSEPRIILQKGDSFKVPEKKQRQKYVAEFATCKGNVKPVVRFVRHSVPVE